MAVLISYSFYASQKKPKNNPAARVDSQTCCLLNDSGHVHILNLRRKYMEGVVRLYNWGGTHLR